MRRRFILYVHEQTSGSSGIDLLMERITDHNVIEVVIDVNSYEVSKSEIEEALGEYIPDVIVCEGLAAFFVHPLCGYNRICVNAELHPSLRCNKSLVKMYQDMERTQLSYDRYHDFADGAHCWGLFGLDVDRREFAMLYYPNITAIPRTVKTVADAIDECVELIQMIGESNYVDNYGVHFSEYGRVLTKVDYALFRELEEYTVPNGVIAIGEGAFCGTNLKRIIISESVNYIGKISFRDCQQLTEVALPSRLQTIQEGCFFNCTSLKKIILPKSLTTVKAKAFLRCNIDMVDVPDNIVTIAPNAFDETVKFVVGRSKFTEVLQQAHDYNLSNIDDDF